MVKRDELTNPASCMSRAKEDEMVFVLLGRDAAAPVAIRAWVEERIRLGKNMRSDGQIAQAEALAAPRIEADDRRESGAGMIAAERSRQVNDEGYAPEGDDGYTQGELTRAAMAYADAARKYVLGGSDFHIQRSWDYWPWDVELFKPRVDPIPNLVRAGALIAARGCLVGAV